MSVLDNGGTLLGVSKQNVLDALNNNYPGMLDYYRRYKNWQHQQMATHYRSTIADILAEFDNNQHSYQFYMDLAWEGLNHRNIGAWKDAIKQSERDRIDQTIKDYIKQHKNQGCE